MPTEFKKTAAILKYESELVREFHSEKQRDRLEEAEETLRAAHLNICEAKIKKTRFKMDTDPIAAEYAEVLNHEALWRALTADEIVRRCVAGVARRIAGRSGHFRG
jgi:hypothetical protein